MIEAYLLGDGSFLASKLLGGNGPCGDKGIQGDWLWLTKRHGQRGRVFSEARGRGGYSGLAAKFWRRGRKLRLLAVTIQIENATGEFAGLSAPRKVPRAGSF